MKKAIWIYCLTLLMSISLFSEDILELSFLGDIMAHDVNFNMPDYDLIYKNVKEILAKDDLTFGNLEFPIVEDLPFATYPRFNVKASYVRAARQASIEVFSLANNHTLDQGVAGVVETLASIIRLKEEFNRELYYSGIRGSQNKEFRPATIYRQGFKIGFLAITEFSNILPTYGLVNMVNYLNKNEAQQFINYLKEICPEYDLFIVSVHAGIEYQLKPTNAKAAFFHQMVQAGVTIVWGHHPHVLQPYEVVEVDGCQRLIMHSLGNFISGQTAFLRPQDYNLQQAYTGDSAIMQVTIKRNALGKAVVAGVRPVLISTYKRPPHNYYIVNLTESLASQDLPDGWQKFYQARYQALRDFFNRKEDFIPPLE